MHTHKRRLIGVLAAGACALLTVSTSAATAAPGGNGRPDQGQKHAAKHPHKPGKKPGKHRHPSAQMPIQLLSFNDFHGNLEPPSGSSGRNIVDHKLGPDPVTGVIKALDVTQDAGGAAYLATHLAQARKGNRNSLTVAAGDLIGASPLLSAAFHDEPTIESMNKLGLDASAVGNHEFDEGYKELQRMDRGGCIADGANGENNQNSCPDHRFRGADFDYLAANVKYAGTDQTILPPYTIKNVHGAKIGFIGMTLEDTPDIVTASGVAGLEFNDEVQTANALVPVLERKGVNAIVVLIHQGGTPDKQTWKDPSRQGVEGQPELRLHLRRWRWQPDPGQLADPADRREPRRPDRHGGLRPHPPALRVRRQGPGGPVAPADLGLVVRSPVHRDQPDLRPPHPRHRAQLGQGRQLPGQPRREAGPGAGAADQQVPEAGRADRRARSSATSPRT